MRFMRHNEEITILMQPESAPINRVRVGCRGIIMKNNKILLSFEEKKDRFFLPGGGLEEGESLEEGCKREILEETGIKVHVIDQLVTVNCIYQGVNFKNHFFVCEYESEAAQKLTQEEAANNLIPYFMEFQEALRFFGNFETYREVDEPLFGCYQRDYKVLKTYEQYYLN